MTSPCSSGFGNCPLIPPRFHTLKAMNCCPVSMAIKPGPPPPFPSPPPINRAARPLKLLAVILCCRRSSSRIPAVPVSFPPPRLAPVLPLSLAHALMHRAGANLLCSSGTASPEFAGVHEPRIGVVPPIPETRRRTRASIVPAATCRAPWCSSRAQEPSASSSPTKNCISGRRETLLR